MKKILGVCLILTTLIVLQGCGGNNSTSTQEKPTKETVQTVKDRAGKDIKVPQKMSKVISLVPAVTQIIEDIGEEKTLVGIDTQSQTLFKNLKSDLPAFDMMNVDVETILSLEPEVIFVNDINLQSNEDVWSKVKKSGITLVEIPTSQSIEGIKKDVQFIADVYSVSSKGKTLVSNMEKKIQAIANIGEKQTNKRVVSFEIAALPEIYSFGKEVYLNEMLEVIGAENAYGEQKGWLPVTEEEAINRNPDVILTNVNYIENPVDEILNRKGWSEIKAVKNKQVYVIDNASSSLPNHHITEAMKEMAQAIYPEAYMALTNE